MFTDSNFASRRYRVIWILGTTLTACAPAANLRSAQGLLPNQRYEVGAGVARVSSRPYVDEPSTVSGQLWFSGKITDAFLFSTIGAFDDEAALGGIAVRWQPLRLDRVAAGIELEGGVLWLGGSLPLALRLVDQTWLYTAPRLANWGAELTPFVPLGLSVRIVAGLSVRVEAQLSWADFEYYNRRLHLALGVAYDF
jgi:hypothetical protein